MNKSQQFLVGRLEQLKRELHRKAPAEFEEYLEILGYLDKSQSEPMEFGRNSEKDFVDKAGGVHVIPLRPAESGFYTSIKTGLTAIRHLLQSAEGPLTKEQVVYQLITGGWGYKAKSRARVNLFEVIRRRIEDGALYRTENGMIDLPERHGDTFEKDGVIYSKLSEAQEDDSVEDQVERSK